MLEMQVSTLGSLDLTLFGTSLAISVFIGLYFANKNKTFADYARGGGDQNLWAVSASMAAGYCSALTLIGNPSELYMHGTSLTLMMGVTIIGWPVSSFVLLPVFKQLNGVSIFQYIELRFHPLLRRFVSLLFIGQMLFYSAITLYLPSLPIKAALGIPQTISIGLIGVICILYSSFGGIKAVTWTNLYHTILVLTSMVSILIVGTIQGGGIGVLLKESYEGERFSAGINYWRFDLTTRHTVYNTLIGYTLVRLFLHGTSQMQVQSALSLSSIRKSQASQLISAVIYFIIQALASALGLLLYTAYRDCDPFVSGQIRRQDELLVHYVSTRLASAGVPAIQGLFLAAIFGSTLTSMSSFQSSTSAMIVEDMIKPIWVRLRGKPPSDEFAAVMGKTAAVVLGISCILITFEMDKISGLQQASTTVYGVIGAPILATFLMGTLTRRTNASGMFCGLASAILFGTWVFISHMKTSLKTLEPSLVVSIAGCRPNTSLPLNLTLDQVELDDLTVLTDGELDDKFDIVELQDEQQQLAGGNHQSLADMSYLWLPVFTFCITVVIASVMSALTGGHTQQEEVDEKLLAPIIKRAQVWPSFWPAERAEDKKKSKLMVKNASLDSLEIYAAKMHQKLAKWAPIDELYNGPREAA